MPGISAGGAKVETGLDALQWAHAALEQGAVGVDMGRNVGQSDYRVPMIRALRAVVHEGASPEEANELLQELKHNREGQPV